jgi:hypothetical protein
MENVSYRNQRQEKDGGGGGEESGQGGEIEHTKGERRDG